MAPCQVVILACCLQNGEINTVLSVILILIGNEQSSGDAQLHLGASCTLTVYYEVIFIKTKETNEERS